MSPELLEAIFSVLIMVGVGLAAKKYKILTDEADTCLLKLVVNILMPCFIFAMIVGNEKVKDPANTLYAPLAGYLGVAVGMLLSLFFAKYIFKIKSFKDGSACRNFAVATGLQNYGYIAIPVIERVFGKDLLGIMLLHNMGVELALWSLGIIILNGIAEKGSLKKIINGPTIAVIISLLINFVGFDAYIPKAVAVSIDQVGAAFIPLGLILVGTTIYGFRDSPAFSRKKWGEAASVMCCGTLLRSGLLPIMIIFMATLMPYTVELRKVVIIEAAMPAAFFPIVLAKHYKGRPDIALYVAMSTLLLGFIFLPFWVSLGRNMLGV